MSIRPIWEWHASHSWSDYEICQRWHMLYRGSPLTQKYLKNQPPTEAELQAVLNRVKQWRRQLMDISWLKNASSRRVDRSGVQNCSWHF